MTSLSLKKKLWLSSGSLLAILLLVGGIGYQTALATDKLVRTVQFNGHKQNLTSAIELAIEKEKVGGRDALLHGDGSYLAGARREFDQQMALLQPLLSTPTSHQLFQQIGDAEAAYRRGVDEALRIGESGDRGRALEVFYGASAQKTRADLKKDTADLVAWYGGLASAAETEQLTNSARALVLILSLSGVGLLLGVMVAVVMARSLIGSIQPIVFVLDQISKHDLSVPDIQVETDDEIGMAGRALNTMKGNLSRLVHDIRLSAEQLGAATEEIAQGARQSSASARSEAQQVTQAASAMQEMSATVREVAGHAHAASEVSGRSAQAARAGGKVAEETLATMSNIASSTGNAAARVLELGRSSEKIGDIVAVITEIAGQTNLLALNAAIEAARAGEQGRGFAVVAGEVRRLAERTGTATQEISAMISTIQAETKSAVEAIEIGHSEVERGVEKTNESGRALSEIIGASEQVGEMVARIASAVSQQETATEQISLSVSSISNLTQASSASADQTAEACLNLSELASNLQRLVNEFSVDHEHLTRLRLGDGRGMRDAARMQPGPLAHSMMG